MFKNVYQIDLDMSLVLENYVANYYQGVIGQLIWAAELGSIVIYIKMYLLYLYLAQPPCGHLDQDFHVFSYLKSHNRSKIILDINKITLMEILPIIIGKTSMEKFRRRYRIICWMKGEHR